MAIVRLSIAELVQIPVGVPVLVPIQTCQGGLIGMIFNTGGRPYRLIGFSVRFNTKANAPTVPTTWTDGRIRLPLRVASMPPPTLPAFDAIAEGDLDLLYVQQYAPPTQALSGPILGYAELHGVIYPGIAQVIVIFNTPDTAGFNLPGVSEAALIVEDYQEGDEWRA